MLTKKDDNFFDTYYSTDPILNWRLGKHDSISGANYSMADGYYECSVFLINECLANNQNKKGDVWIFPIMFCVNQFLELYIKGIITQIKQIKFSKKSDWNIDVFEGAHSINDLSKELYVYQRDNHKHMLAPLDKLQVIVDFTEILFEQEGFDITFARYPTAINKDKKTKKERPNKHQFFNSSYENCRLNLRLYLQWVNEIYDILDGIACNLCAQIEVQKNEEG